MRRLKVLIIISNLKIAGAQKMVEQLALAIDKTKFEVHVVSLSSALNTVIERKLIDNQIPLVFLNKKSGVSIGAFFKLSKYIKAFKPDIIHSHIMGWFYALPVCIMKKIPILHTIHSQPKRQESNKLLRALVRKMYHSKRMIPVGISDQISEEAVQVYKLGERFIDTVYNPVDYSGFSAIVREEHEGVNFVNVARFNKIKNQIFLLKAFVKVHEEFPHYSLYFAGDGELLEEAKTIVRSLGANGYIHFLGNVDNVPMLFSKCDVFVLPSLSEGLPVSMLEAEAASLPIIASRIGGIPDIFHENGFLFEVNNENELIECLAKMNNSSFRKKFGENSKKIACQYSAEKIARKYESLYEKYRKQL